jgi:amino acid transporter
MTTTAGQTQGVALKRHVGSIGLLFASVGSIIGSGWLFGALTAAQLAGPAAIFSWAIGAVMILLIGLVWAEMGTMFPLSGGVVRFPHLAFGSFASFTNAWITWVACATVAPIEVEAALQYGTKYAPFTTSTVVDGEPVHTLTALGYGTAAVLMGVFVLINYIGIRWFARVNNTLVWWKLAIICLVVVAFFATSFNGANFSRYGFTPTGWHGVFTAISTGGIVFSYLGFRQGIELAGETDNPRRNVPLSVIGSVLLTGVLYIVLQIAFIGAVDPSDLASSNGWAKLDFANSFGPLAAIATIIGLGWLAVLLYIDAVISPGDTGLIYTTTTSRISYAMGRNRNAPEALARTNKQGVPWVSLLLAYVVGLIVFLPFPSWQQLVGFITSATVLSFAPGPLIMVALRKQIPDQERPFRVPGGHVIPFLAFFASNMIIYWSGWTVNWKLMVAVLLGFALLGVGEMLGKARPNLELKAGATWVLPWLVGLTVISWLGDYDGLGVITFGVAIPIILVFSAAIYAIAYKVRLDPETARQHIDEARAESAVEEREIGHI